MKGSWLQPEVVASEMAIGPNFGRVSTEFRDFLRLRAFGQFVSSPAAAPPKIIN